MGENCFHEPFREALATVFRKDENVRQVSKGSAIRCHPSKADLSPIRIRRAFPEGIDTKTERISNRTRYDVSWNTARPIAPKETDG